MNRIFLAYPFRDENERLVTAIARLAKSHGCLLETGDICGGEDLTIAIKDKIAKSDALIALLARDEKFEGREEWRATDWVAGELVSARARGQRAIAIVETGVRYNGPYEGHERIPFDRAKLHDLFLRLSETIGFWKEEAGRFLDVRLLPPAAADAALTKAIKCRYRLIQKKAAPGAWQLTRAHRSPGGAVFIDVSGVRPEDNIEIELIEGEQARWRSSEWPQWVHIELELAN